MNQIVLLENLQLGPIETTTMAGLYADLFYKEYVCAYIEKCRHKQIHLGAQ